MSAIEGMNLQSTFLRLRNDASVEPLPVDDTFWERIMGGKLGSFHNEYLVASFTHEADWPIWEMHPNGDEIVCLIDGAVTFVLEVDGGRREIELDEPMSFVFVPRGTWHTARIRARSQMLFITPGEGTQHREA